MDGEGPGDGAYGFVLEDELAGELIGTIPDYTGKEVERLHSLVDGYARYGITGPLLRAGDRVVTIAIPTTPI